MDPTPAWCFPREPHRQRRLGDAGGLGAPSGGAGVPQDSEDPADDEQKTEDHQRNPYDSPNKGQRCKETEDHDDDPQDDRDHSTREADDQCQKPPKRDKWPKEPDDFAVRSSHCALQD